MIYIQVVLKEYTNVPTAGNMYKLFYEQAVCRRGKKTEKSLLDDEAGQ